MASKGASFRLQVVFGKGTKLIFDSFLDAYEWFAIEVRLLEDIATTAKKNDLGLTVRFDSLIEEASAIRDTARGLADAAPKVSESKQFSDRITAYFESQDTSMSLDDRKMLLAEILPEELEHKQTNYINTNLSSVFGVKELVVVESLKEERKQLHESIDDVRPISKGDLKPLKNDVDLLDERVQVLDNLVKRLQRDEKGKNEALNEQLSHMSTKLDSVENAAEAHLDDMALNEASRYWEIKRKQHFKRQKFFLTMLTLWVLLSIYILFQTLNDYRLNVKFAQDVFDLLPYLPTNILLVALSVWGTRLMVRFLLSEHHLASRAEEKGVLIKTYLALRVRGAVSDGDKATILGSIFRHSQDGLVEDDAMPIPGYMNLITRPEKSQSD